MKQHRTADHHPRPTAGFGVGVCIASDCRPRSHRALASKAIALSSWRQVGSMQGACHQHAHQPAAGMQCPPTCCRNTLHVIKFAQSVYIGSKHCCIAGCSRCSYSCSSICCTSAGRKATSSGGEWKLMHAHLLVCAACIEYPPALYIEFCWQ